MIDWVIAGSVISENNRSAGAIKVNVVPVKNG